MLPEVRNVLCGRKVQTQDETETVLKACNHFGQKEFQQVIDLLEGSEGFWAMLLLSKAYYSVDQFKKAGSVLVERAWPCLPSEPAEKAEAEKWFAVLMHKSIMARDSVEFSGEVNKLAVIDSIKAAAEDEETKSEWQVDPKYDWYQNATHVFITFKVKKGDLRNSLEC
jgi:hypothetical protein